MTKKKTRGGGGRRRPITEKKTILSVEIEKSDKNRFLVKVKKEKQRVMTPEELRFTSSYYKFLSPENKMQVDRLVGACVGL